MSCKRHWIGMSGSTNPDAIIRSQQKLDEDKTSVPPDSSFIATSTTNTAIESLPFVLNQAGAQTNLIINAEELTQPGYSQLYPSKEEAITAVTTTTDSTPINRGDSAIIFSTTEYGISSEISPSSANRQNVKDQYLQKIDTQSEFKPVLYSEPNQATNLSESNLSEIKSSKRNFVNENITLLQEQVDYAIVSADHCHVQLEQQQIGAVNLTGQESTNVHCKNKLGYQLRALKEDISALESDPWIQAPTLPNILQTSSLSTELVNETLNYFVNCGQRLSQMTKTYDDNDAYMLLLQEKEVDLELAARIGQDLLKQNKELKDSIKSLHDELSKRQDDVFQLKHELASKTSLLETFIVEEEERQNSHNEGSEAGVSTYRHQDCFLERLSTPADLSQNYVPSPINPTRNQLDHEEDDNHNCFSSLNTPRPAISSAEPFSSLSYHVNYSNSADLKQHVAARDDCASSICEDYNSRAPDNQGLIQTVTFQLVESNKRLCELQDEISFKGEQNILQQEKIFQLQEQLRDSDRRLGEIAIENEALQRSMAETVENRKELYDELKSCKNNFCDLLKVFLELQKESRLYRMRNENNNWNLNYLGAEAEQLSDMNNVSFDSFHDSTSYEALANNNNHHHQNSTRPFANNMPMSSSLLDELQESVEKGGEVDHRDDSSDGGATTDSGVHTHNTISKSTSATPTTNGPLNEVDTESDESGPREEDAETEEEEKEGTEDGMGKRSWLGLSSFMLTTLLILCLSVTFSSSSNLNLAHRLQIKLDR